MSCNSGPWAKLRRFWRRPLFERLWFLPVWGLLGIARLIVLIVPGSRLLSGLGQTEGGLALSLLPTMAQSQRAGRIGRIIRSAAAYTPWHSNCLAQALVARLLLVGYSVPHVLFFGLSHGGAKMGRLEAHAWVMVGATAITGGDSFARYVVVGVFPFPQVMDKA